MFLYICIGIWVLASLFWRFIWPLIEARLRPAHVADLKAGRKCIRCGEPISEGDTPITAYGHKFGLAHLECEKDGLVRAGYNSCLTIGMIILFLLLAAGDLQRIVQGKMHWTHAGTGFLALGLILAEVRDRFDRARWRRRVDGFVAEHPQNEKEFEECE